MPTDNLIGIYSTACLPSYYLPITPITMNHTIPLWILPQSCSPTVTTAGPTLSPVARLCGPWEPSHIGNFFDNQHLQRTTLSPALSVNLSVIFFPSSWTGIRWLILDPTLVPAASVDSLEFAQPLLIGPRFRSATLPRQGSVTTAFMLLCLISALEKLF